jgi:phage tail sheath protein FI
MPVTPTYPGVYVQEIASGVRTITGVATSITALIGWAPKGPIDRAELVLSWSDYERKFGGLNRQSQLSYAVSQFFANGGQRAYIVRLVPPSSAAAADQAIAATVTLDGKLTVTAKNPGAWGNNYAIVTKVRTDDATRFRLLVADVSQTNIGIVVESFENLSMTPNDPRFVETVLRDESDFMGAQLVAGATAPPTNTDIPANGANAGVIPPAARLTKGQDGKVLQPDQADFSAALSITSGTGGVQFLTRIDLFNLLCVPGLTAPTVLATLQKFCRDHRAFLIADAAVNDTLSTLVNGPNSAMTGADAINAAFYFPWVKAPDPLQENRLSDYPPSGFVAGLYARTDASRGVWKAPAGTEASLSGAAGLKTVLTDDENGVLNPKAVDCIRTFPVYGTVVWGARTLQGNDERGSEWKYVPVRRTALYIEESLYRGLKWVVFEPNDEPLWAQIRLNVGAFMQDLFRQGAFQGKTPRDAYFVKCDKETTTQSDINKGIVNIIVGFAPLKPAEFVILTIQQIAGQIQV